MRFIIPGTAGSAPDRTTRVFAEKLSQKWGVPVVVENRTGATATIGTAYVAKQPADGYTLLSTFTAFVQAPLLMADAQYDPVKDFIPVTQTMTAETVLSIRADSSYRTFADFAAAAKRDKPRLTYGSSGNGSSFNIYGETMKRGAGIPLTHVPYKGETLSLTDLLGGQITVNMNSIATALPHIQAGKLRPLAVVSPARSPPCPMSPPSPNSASRISTVDRGSAFSRPPARPRRSWKRFPPISTAFSPTPPYRNGCASKAWNPRA